MSDLYINRTLFIDGQSVPDRDLLQRQGLIVVLAEPGAGKTEFLNFLARNLGVLPIPATIFQHRPDTTHVDTLLIDSLDEVARIDESATNAILIKAHDSGAGTVILASRSYVWDESRTANARVSFGIEPTIIRLQPFDENEQQQLFQDRFPEEQFQAFHQQAERFELTPLLGNPQLLLLFADAYMESGRRFSSKGRIYIDAVRRMANERNEMVSQRNRPPIDKIVDLTSEIFGKLLLSGSIGVSASEDVDDHDYPYFLTLSNANPEQLRFVLNTRLFKPATTTGSHEPVHRIVAEYCAAGDLISRIQDPTNVLSLRRCLAVIAPNGVVRTELRGMLGWMASRGGREVQETLIDLDPYAVLANGDPSQLLPASKSRLLHGLESLADIDPYFRGMDAWRRFSTVGFFTTEIVDDVRRLLRISDQDTHLKGLLLELLQGTPVVPELVHELTEILLNRNAHGTIRHLAQLNLATLHGHDHLGDFKKLIAEGSADALEIASEMVAEHGVQFIGRDNILTLLQSLARLYPVGQTRDRTIGSRYFIRQLVKHFQIGDVRAFLNEITPNISCTCGKGDFRCECRLGICKIAGLLLDRYFEISQQPSDPRQIAAWTVPLHFQNTISAERSPSVQSLNAESDLRQAVHRIIFESLKTPEQIHAAAMRFCSSHSHAGLIMHSEDVRAIVDHAFETRNLPLWSHFFAAHFPYTEPKGIDHLRAHMRAQARQSPDFLRVWSKLDKDSRAELRKYRPRRGYSRRAFELSEAQERETLQQHLHLNREQVEAGRHWGWLKTFAHNYLYNPTELDDIVDDRRLVESALLNSFPFIEEHVPSLEQISAHRGGQVVMVLHAACLARYRDRGTLDGISIKILRAVKTESGNGSGYRQGEEKKFDAELNRLLFYSDQDAIDFANRLIEPQLLQSKNEPTQVSFLNHDPAFDGVKGALALDWLTRYPEMPFSAMDTLFKIAAEHSNRPALNELIARRCNNTDVSSEIALERRKFWLLRHFFFITPTSDIYWKEFSANSNAIFAIENHIGRFWSDEAKGWPRLNAEKIYRILDAFVESWPRVDLPSTWGTGDPEEETAYRFLQDTVYQIGNDDPSIAIPVCDRILADQRFKDFHAQVKSRRADLVRKQALSGFSPPSVREVTKLLDEGRIASVSDLRAILVELLHEVQEHLKGAATNPLDVFYSDGRRVDENTARNRIVEMLEPRLNAKNMTVAIEHQMANAKRCDFTASTSIDGRPVVLVTEVKGQWHDELYTAASTQLAERYMIYPGAAHQGIYLVLWFGGDEVIAGKKSPSIKTPAQLKDSIIQAMPTDLHEHIDVVVLDISRPPKIEKKRNVIKRRK